MTAEPLAARKAALIERAALARLHLRRKARMLRTSLADRPATPRLAVRFAIGAAVTLIGLSRGARIAGWMRRGLVAANVCLAMAGFVASRVRNRTDVAGNRAHPRRSTGEQL